jgi:signal peptidase I
MTDSLSTRPGRRQPSAALQWLAIIAVALLASLALRTWVLETFKIPSGSMEPTIQIDDRILVDKLASGRAHRGEIIVFKRTAADATQASRT